MKKRLLIVGLLLSLALVAVPLLTLLPETNLGGAIFMVWLLVTIATCVAIFACVAKRPGTVRTKALVLLAILAGWASAQFIAAGVALLIGYCENCAGKPISERDVIAMLVLLAPTTVTLTLLLFKGWPSHRPPANQTKIKEVSVE